VAIVERGTTQQQRTLQGSLKDLSDLAAQAESPSLIIIGSVTQLASKLDWFSATIDSANNRS